MINDNITVTGKLNVVLIDEMGAVKEDHVFDNLVVTSGKSFIASRMKDATATVMTHMAIGTDNTAAAVGNTALGSQANRQALTSTTVNTNAVTYAATFAGGQGTGAIVEAGLFNASSGGTMLCRTVFPVINKAAADTLSVSWVVTVS